MDLYIERLEPLYEKGKPYALGILRTFSGVALMTSGYPKLLDLYGNIEMVESLGFYPGELWSPALAIAEFGAGLLLLIGFLTRFAAGTALVILMVAAYFHWAFLGEGYSGAEKALLWASICLFFMFHGSGRYSLDNAIGKEL